MQPAPGPGASFLQQPCSNYFLLFSSPAPCPCSQVPRGLPGLLRKGKCKVSCRQAALIYGALQPCQTPNLLSEGGKASSPVENVLLGLGRGEGQELVKEVPLPVQPLPCPHLAVPQFLLSATGRHSFLLDRLQGGGRHTAGA